jgi:hypothetical protein
MDTTVAATLDACASIVRVASLVRLIFVRAVTNLKVGRMTVAAWAFSSDFVLDEHGIF